MSSASTPRIACVVLAAGAGTRYGDAGDKLVSTYNDRPLLQHAVDAAAGSCASTCAIVLGAAADRVAAAVDPRRAAIYRNDDWRLGLSASIRLAVAVHQDADACVFILGDAPHVCSADVDRAMERWTRDQHRIVMLRAGNVWGPPAVFPRADFAALRRLRGDAGAKAIALREPRRLVFVEASSAHAFADVDRRPRLSGRNDSRTNRTRRSPARP